MIIANSFLCLLFKVIDLLFERFVLFLQCLDLSLESLVFVGMSYSTSLLGFAVSTALRRLRSEISFASSRFLPSSSPTRSLM